MIAEAAPDLVVAFPDGLGTAGMIERAKENALAAEFAGMGLIADLLAERSP